MHPTIAGILAIAILLIVVCPMGIVALSKSRIFMTLTDWKRAIAGTLMGSTILCLLVELLMLISRFPGVD